MVQVLYGQLIRCDPTIKELILKINESRELGECFVLADLDDTHLFISEGVSAQLREKLAAYANELHFVEDEKE